MHGSYFTTYDNKTVPKRLASKRLSTTPSRSPDYSPRVVLAYHGANRSISLSISQCEIPLTAQRSTRLVPGLSLWTIFSILGAQAASSVQTSPGWHQRQPLVLDDLCAFDTPAAAPPLGDQPEESGP